MDKKKKNVAYIDAANLHKGIASLGWKLDYGRFRIWLKEKYRVEVAYLFIGLIPRNKDLYTRLQKYGFTLIFKVVYDGFGKAKGNCDADLVIQAMQDVYEADFEKAILVTSDGDYAPLVAFLLARGKLQTILSPSSSRKCSILLKERVRGFLLE